jgi:hypothetical protein
MKAKKISRTTSAPATTVLKTPPPTREQIEALAQAIWTDRGCPTGCDVEIWLEAERQLCGQTGVVPPGVVTESVDPERSEAGRVDRELERIVRPPEQRSPTAL